MTDQNDRENQIEKAAREIIGENADFNELDCFARGARWSDENVKAELVEKIAIELHKIKTLRQQLAIAKEGLHASCWCGGNNEEDVICEACLALAKIQELEK